MGKGKSRPGNQRPRSGKGPTYVRPTSGGTAGTGGTRTPKGPKGGMSSSVTGPVSGLVWGLSATALAFVGTPVGYLVWSVVVSRG